VLFTISAVPPLVAGATTFPPLRGGTMGAGHFIQFEFMAVAEGKPSQPGLRPVGNAPLLPPAAASLHGKASHEIFSRLPAPYKFRSLATPPGEILAALCLVMLMRELFS
jgi:hypothetical protein